MLFLILALSQVLGHDYYCPDESSYDFYNGASWTGNGWSVSGEGRVYGRTSWNMLGGYVEFDMDTSSVQAGVNSNFYTISPEANNYAQYCDIQACNDGSCPRCMEMDIVENNGNCWSATTIHTHAGTGMSSNCNQWGCQSGMYSSNTRHFKAEFSESGRMTVTIGGQQNANYNPYPSGESDSVVVQTMKSKGAKLISTQWIGYAPGEDNCPGGGSLDGSTFSVKNVRVYGTIIMGDTTVPKCSGPEPPSPSPGPSPSPKPGNCANAWEQCGGQDWKGTTCCNGNCACKYVNEWYSMCTPPNGNVCYSYEEEVEMEQITPIKVTF